MALAKKCDICGKLYEEYHTQLSNNDHNGLMFLNIYHEQSYFSSVMIDCCPGCMKSIKYHIDYLRNGGESNSKMEVKEDE